MLRHAKSQNLCDGSCGFEPPSSPPATIWRITRHEPTSPFASVNHTHRWSQPGSQPLHPLVSQSAIMRPSHLGGGETLAKVWARASHPMIRFNFSDSQWHSGIYTTISGDSVQNGWLWSPRGPCYRHCYGANVRPTVHIFIRPVGMHNIHLAFGVLLIAAIVSNNTHRERIVFYVLLLGSDNQYNRHALG